MTVESDLDKRSRSNKVKRFGFSGAVFIVLSIILYSRTYWPDLIFHVRETYGRIYPLSSSQ